jgi:TonB family protein
LAIAAVALSGARLAGAQAHTDSARCDSIVASTAGVVDSVSAVIFVFVAEIRGDRMTYEQRDLIESRIARTFVPPSPLGLSVFEGPALARALRISSGADTLGIPRGASVSGTYRIEVTESGAVSEVEVLRSSLMRGLDSALIRAIRSAAGIGTAFRPVSGGGDRWRLEIRIGGDSVDGAQRLAQGTFPRMRVRDATPASKERPAFPEEARADSLDHGEVVLRFVVDRDGAPALETVELVRSTDLPFTRAALRALASLRFRPATIRGCPVAQVIEFPFIFDDTERPPPRAL